MFNKLFKRKAVPTNSGDPVYKNFGPIRTVKHFELELSNMENSPVYELKDQLTIGNEIGNIVIADPSISPRHATFILQQDVISVIDHGSLAGTFVNGSKLQAGKYIILEESDVIKVGDLELKIRTRVETTQETIPGISIEITREFQLPKELQSPPEELPSEDADDIEVLLEASHRDDDDNYEKAETGKKAKTKKKAKRAQGAATNSLVRVAANICDFLIAYSLLVIFLPFDDFRGFLEFVPDAVLGMIPVDWTSLWGSLTKDYGFVAVMLSGVYTFITATFQVGQLLLMYLLLRLASTLMLGVSLSEFLLGVRASGNGIWARVGGVLRVLLGAVTGPLLVFDLPAIVSKRTLKEVITLTGLHNDSRLVPFIGTVILLPALLLVALLSPLVIGLEPPVPVAVNDKIEQKIRVKTPVVEGVVSEEKFVSGSSRYFKMDLSYNSNELTIIPSFRFSGVKSKLNFKSAVKFYQRDLKREVDFAIYKTFDLKKLLGFGMKGNLFLYEKFPIIYEYVYSITESNPAFKKPQDEKSEGAFANEFIEFTKMAFGLHAENALEVMQSQTLLLRGLLDFKASFLALIEYKDFDQIGFIKIGNVIFMKVSFLKQQPFDLIIPLVKDQGRIYKVTFDKKEQLGAVTNKFYKYDLDKADWILPDEVAGTEVLTPFGVIDLFTSITTSNQSISPEKAQALYAYYFEKSQEIMTRDDALEIGIWKTSLGSVLKVIEGMDHAETPEGAPQAKLLQNFRDLIDAFENKNLEYFGVPQSTSV
ncbi:MAG TPA: FHA domain-containing protein [Bacteriovoracaceae bacterium]|nr:FHA domain-containing protein [Bacteriovoracaceae bacterium]